MQRAAAAVCCVLLNLTPLAAHAAHAQKGLRPDTVRLEDMKQIRRGVDAWPLIAEPDTPATQRINATLSQMNRELKASIRECDANYRAWAQQTGQYLHGKSSVSNDWIRTIRVTMTGPHFLSLVARDDYKFCGGAHPDSNTAAMLFDLSTGNPVDWTTLIAASADASVRVDPVGGATVALPALRALSVDAAEPDCREVFADKQPYVLWPDPRDSGVMAWPADLPHEEQSCALPLTLTLPQARQMGFSDALLSAIAQANQE